MADNWNKVTEAPVEPSDWVGDTPPGEKWTIAEMDWALIKNLTIDQIDAMTMANSNPTTWTPENTPTSDWTQED